MVVCVCVDGRRELYELVKAGVITERDMEDSIKGEFNPMRVRGGSCRSSG